jgi:hypothetical protein
MSQTTEDRSRRRAFDAFFEGMLATLKPHILADEKGGLKPPVPAEYSTESIIEFVSWS